MVPHSRSIAWATHEGDRVPPAGYGLPKRAKKLLTIPAPPRPSIWDRKELGPGDLKNTIAALRFRHVHARFPQFAFFCVVWTSHRLHERTKCNCLHVSKFRIEAFAQADMYMFALLFKPWLCIDIRSPKVLPLCLCASAAMFERMISNHRCKITNKMSVLLLANVDLDL